MIRFSVFVIRFSVSVIRFSVSVVRFSVFVIRFSVFVIRFRDSFSVFVVHFSVFVIRFWILRFRNDVCWAAGICRFNIALPRADAAQSQKAKLAESVQHTSSGRSICFLDFGFRSSGFGFRISRIVVYSIHWVSGPDFCVSIFGFHASGLCV